MLARSPKWPPDYDEVLKQRHRLLVRMLNMNPKQLAGAISFYSSGLDGCVAFMEDWCETFDPRNAGVPGRQARMPMRMFPKQFELVEFLYSCYEADANGLIEKSRDMGATWVCVNFSTWLFLFQRGATIGWGSRKAMYVDKIGSMDSIFEKLRFQVLATPRILWPKGFDPSIHMAQMKIYDTGTGNAITGEAGDDIGRGGRNRVYFKDESAHYEHPEMIQAALDDNTRVQIDISSVNGLGNVFHRKREGGLEWRSGQTIDRSRTNVFIMDWSDHPNKTRAWYEQRRQTAMDEGLLHKFAQEVDRDYSASVVGTIVPAEWVKSAIDAHVKLGWDTGRGWHAGLDVADEGGDRNALVTRRGILVTSADEWGAPDVGATTRRSIDLVESLVPRNTKGRVPCRVYYDSVGVGAGVKAESNRLEEDGTLTPGIKFFSWNAGAGVLDPDAKVEESSDGEAPTNKQFFMNLKAQAWWSLRRRFEKTHRAVTEGVQYPVDELISIPSELPKLRTLQKELSQPTSKKSATMKLMVDKKPEGTRSPNLADALVQCFFPVEATDYDSSMDWV